MEEPASSLSWFADPQRWYEPRSGMWKFTGRCTSPTENYYVMLHHRGHGFLDGVEARSRWLEHLAEKRWFDRAAFTAMLARFVAAGGPRAVLRSKGYSRRMRQNVKPSPSKVRGLPQLEPVA